MKTFICTYSDSKEFTKGKVYTSRSDFANKNLITSNNNLPFFIPAHGLLLLGLHDCAKFEEKKAK